MPVGVVDIVVGEEEVEEVSAVVPEDDLTVGAVR